MLWPYVCRAQPMWRATTSCLQGLAATLKSSNCLARPLRMPRSIRAISTCDTSLDDTVELLERYCPGGYHPMHVGNDLSRDRSCVTHKLGWDTVLCC
ncbi:hypothetical protein BDZ85DRAFT_854 [Elsinoe ampelina]|uniref:Uncharacterized protein n=1 Tax=Elsinoe ampelina TaxID=302913 RepID=A0A6A6GNF1_9PEZI|nr:hypothetical protein BDZ85DRAFT_854 [Elsinoe ampelina]